MIIIIRLKYIMIPAEVIVNGFLNFFDLSTNPKLFAILRNIINETKLNKKNSNNHL